MTDAPLPAAAAAPASGRPRRSVESRPDARLTLLEAIQRRDGAAARLLAERWVHRRGLASLEAFQRITLQTVEGPEGCRWLQQQLRLDPPSPEAGALASALGPEIRLHDLIPLDEAGAPRAPAEPLPSVEEAFAALAAEFSAPSPTAAEAPIAPAAPPVTAAAPTPDDLEAIAAGGLDEVEASLLPPLMPALPLSFEIPGASIAATEAAAAAGSVAPEEPLVGPAAPEEQAAATPAGEGLRRPRRRFSFGGVRSLVRDCLEEAVAGLRGAEAAPERSPAPAAFEAPEGPEAFEAPFVPAGAAEEPLAPLPAFHPTASILAALPDPVAAEAAPAAPRWLPRLGMPAPSRRPAPAPADLADLRAWLPDAGEDLPRAC